MRAEIPSTLRLSSPKRVGPLLSKTQIIYKVQVPVSKVNKDSKAHLGDRSYNQVSVQEWKDGKVIKERFYYGS